LAIPARFREFLEEKGDDRLIVTNLDRCLWAYAWEDWRVIEEKAANLPEFNRSAFTYLRYFISGAVECKVKQGRITIPQDLKGIAGLKKEVILVGALKKFEIWDKDLWGEEFNRSMTNFPVDSQSLADLGI